MRKKAIVTGASRGIGKGIAMCLAEEGYDLAISYVSKKEEADKVVEQISETYHTRCFAYQAALQEKGAGKALFDQSCIACHGASGEGNVLLGGPNLTDDIWLYSAADPKDTDALRTFIMEQTLQPKNFTMPAWKDTLGDARIKVVAAYVYSLSQDPIQESSTPSP